MQDKNDDTKGQPAALILTLAPQPQDISDLANVDIEYLLDVNGAARVLNVTVSWVYEHIRDDADDRVPHVKLGKYVRFHPADLRDFVNAKRRSTGARKR